MTTHSSRRSASRAPVTVALLVLVALLAAACAGKSSTGGAFSAAGGSPASASAPRAGGTLTVAIATDPISLNPRAYSFSDNYFITRQIVDSLVAQDPASGAIRPWLASSWTVNADATAFTFRLRQGVTFSDGTPLTAAVVKANFDDIFANKASVNPVVLASLPGYKSTTVSGTSTVTVSFGSPAAPFLQAASEPDFGIVAQATLNEPWSARANRVIGSGPFVLDSYTANNQAVLSKRTGYSWAPSFRRNTGSPYLDKVVFKSIPQGSVRTGSLESGDINVAADIQPADIKNLQQDGFAVSTRSTPGTPDSLVVTGSSRPPLNDLSVRRAISLGINRDEVRTTAYDPSFKVATSALSSTTPGYTDLSSQLKFDPGQAKSLLAQDGWVPGNGGIRTKDGKKLSVIITWPQADQSAQGALELIKTQLAAIGVDLQILPQGNAALLEGLKSVKYDLLWSGSTLADGDVLRGAYNNAPPNYYNITDAGLQPLLLKQAATSDTAARDQDLGQAQQRILGQEIAIPVIEQTAVVASGKSVHGLTLDASSRIPQLTDVWLS